MGYKLFFLSLSIEFLTEDIPEEVNVAITDYRNSYGIVRGGWNEGKPFEFSISLNSSLR